MRTTAGWGTLFPSKKHRGKKARVSLVRPACSTKEPHEKIESTCLLFPGAAFVVNFQCIVHIYLFVSPSHPAVQACTGAGRTAPWPGCSSRRRSRTWRPSCWARRGTRTRPHREGPAKRSSRCRGPPRPRSGRTSRAEIHIYFDIFFVHALPPTTTNCCFVSDQDRVTGNTSSHLVARVVGYEVENQLEVPPVHGVDEVAEVVKVAEQRVDLRKGNIGMRAIFRNVRSSRGNESLRKISIF